MPYKVAMPYKVIDEKTMATSSGSRWNCVDCFRSHSNLMRSHFLNTWSLLKSKHYIQSRLPTTVQTNEDDHHFNVYVWKIIQAPSYTYIFIGSAFFLYIIDEQLKKNHQRTGNHLHFHNTSHCPPILFNFLPIFPQFARDNELCLRKICNCSHFKSAW